MARFLSTVWAVVTGTLLLILSANTLGFVLFAIGVGLFLEGLVLLGIAFGIVGMWIVFKTDDVA